MAENNLDGWPRWLREFDQMLATRPQIVVYGNVRDVCILPLPDGAAEKTVVDALGFLLQLRHAAVLKWDPTCRISLDPPGAIEPLRSRMSQLKIADPMPSNLNQDALPDWIESLTTAQDFPIAMIIDYASRLGQDPNGLDDASYDLFLRCLRLSHTARECRSPGPGAAPRYNPVIWIAERIQDLPAWFLVGNSRIGQIGVPLPDHDVREAAAKAILPHFPNPGADKRAIATSTVKQLADLTEGMPLRAIKDIKALSGRYALGPSELSETVRRYRVGLPDNPWSQGYVKDRIRTARKFLSFYVEGQDPAVDTATAILTRAYMGLSGAQAERVGSRPRGVMFLAGPTGVGKTELAKSITRLLFNDERACVRFDMSEFSSEHAEARLIGAPPGYVGFDAGGELVNAVRQRPFSVLLFDEIEKAHPRILDKFLQILEDGRLTDGRGDTAHFSECLLVFTTNLGVYTETESGRVLNVSPDQEPLDVRTRIKAAIEHHFRTTIGRPELLNRVGGNIIVFDFIRPDVARRIVEKMVAKVMSRVHLLHGVEVVLSPAAMRTLLDRATDDPSNGGRGIGNRIETLLINPLATLLFNLGLPKGGKLEISALTDNSGVPGLDLS
jgi:energy-coupling factor transporter ATP-binding protein EcfA2